MKKLTLNPDIHGTNFEVISTWIQDLYTLPKGGFHKGSHLPYHKLNKTVSCQSRSSLTPSRTSVFLSEASSSFLQRFYASLTSGRFDDA